MIGVTLLFLLFSGIVFLGYVLNALFSRIKISGVLPLMLVGLLLGPVLHIVNNSSGSAIALAEPYVSAIAIAFILFEAGLNVKISTLSKVLSKTVEFTFSLALFIGIVLGIIFWVDIHWNLLISLVAGFALAGPSAVIIPTIMKIANINPKLKSALLFESVVTDAVQLILPIVLLSILVTGNANQREVVGMLLGFFVASPILGIAFSFLWAFVLSQFAEYSKGYSWMLTITMVIGAYGIVQALGLSGAVSTFVFGIFFANLPRLPYLPKKYKFDIGKEFKHIKDYQKEIVFFVSTFFFVYIGLTVNLGQINLFLIAVSIVASIAILGARLLFLPMLKSFFSSGAYSEKILAGFDMPRGLSPAIVAAMPAAFGISVPGLIDLIFLVIVFTNVINTVGMFFYAKRLEIENKSIS